jgi:cytochrome c-type biogenesis protein CcmH
MAKWILAIVIALSTSVAMAADAAPASDDPVLEARMLKLTSELRCLVCQNQTIADSHAELAVDLRNQVREMLKRGDTDQQVTEYMTARYGDFVLYRPPVNSKTALLWFGPGVLLVGGLVVLVLILRRRTRMDPSLFEPDPEDQVAEEASPPSKTSNPS